MNFNFYVYILTNKYRTAYYTGVTNDLCRRVIEHKIKINEGFTNDYNVNRLVHYELFFNIKDAIAREKRLKRWNRLWKINLIEKTNPNWIDLAESIGITTEIIANAKIIATRKGDPLPVRGPCPHKC
jgi:putative endonuclease